MFERSRGGERALLIQPWPARSGREPEVVEEFAELARSAGAGVVATLEAPLTRPSPATLIGSGKLEQARDLCIAGEIDLVLVNHPLTPVQERNLEKALERRVVDRTGLILDIFAQRARSHEGKLQVELAQLRHLSTRLVRGWTHLERQRGGAIGLRGPGETQLETDRRLLSRRVIALQKRLDRVDVQHAQMRRARVRNPQPRVALVGYTNAGKSTLFNALTASTVYVADKLFATLDPTVRKLQDLPCGPLMLSDTVGFVRDLPHELVAAFRSTLVEARDADLLLHVVDAADPLREERIGQVDAVLEEIGAGDLPQLLVFNKLDRVEGSAPRHDPGAALRPAAVWVSALTGAGLPLLRDALAGYFSAGRVHGELVLGPDQGRLRARLHQLGAVSDESATERGWRLRIDLPGEAARRLAASADGGALKPLLLAAGGQGS